MRVPAPPDHFLIPSANDESQSSTRVFHSTTRGCLVKYGAEVLKPMLCAFGMVDSEMRVV